MPKYKVPDSITHVVIAGRAYEPEDGVLTIGDDHAAAIAAASGNGFSRHAESGGDKKTPKPARKAS
jgi:hypothetical protein